MYYTSIEKAGINKARQVLVELLDQPYSHPRLALQVF
jgi:hypothetical protein